MAESPGHPGAVAPVALTGVVVEGAALVAVPPKVVAMAAGFCVVAVEPGGRAGLLACVVAVGVGSGPAHPLARAARTPQQTSRRSSLVPNWFLLFRTPTSIDSCIPHTSRQRKWVPGKWTHTHGALVSPANNLYEKLYVH
jgi:hypothetical protein